jgi:putative FmdB family regulatory protein
VPLYEYQCVKCGKKTEKIEPVAGPHLKKCPHCAGKVEQTLTAPAIQFKGSGWYVTDYAGKSAAKEGASTGSSTNDSNDAGSKESSSKESNAKESKETKESKASKDSKETKSSKRDK